MMAREELTMRPRAIGALPVRTARADVAALRTHAGHQKRHVPGDRAHLGQLVRIGRAHHEEAVAARIPAAGGQLRHHFVELAAADVQILQIAAAGIGGAAQHDDARDPRSAGTAPANRRPGRD